jgi:mono/diheme cytochrome c family protein
MAAKSAMSVAAAAGLILGAAAARPDDGPVQTSGNADFKTYCASCHGPEARGDGPIAQHLRTVPPDLTRLTQRNKGRFDTDRVHRIVDGREPVKGHGGPDMPVWGDAFKQSGEGYSEAKVRARISAIVEYLESLQSDAARP